MPSMKNVHLIREQEITIFISKFFLSVIVCFCVAGSAFAECGDYDAKMASNKSAEEYVKGKTFKRALILKRHLPSKRKEVASYVFVKKTGLYYTVYSLVNSDCDAEVIKRTNGKF